MVYAMDCVTTVSMVLCCNVQQEERYDMRLSNEIRNKVYRLVDDAFEQCNTTLSAKLEKNLEETVAAMEVSLREAMPSTPLAKETFLVILKHMLIGRYCNMPEERTEAELIKEAAALLAACASCRDESEYYGIPAELMVAERELRDTAVKLNNDKTVMLNNIFVKIELCKVARGMTALGELMVILSEYGLEWEE